MSSAKGDRRERQAVDIYERAGFEVERATGGGHHSPDFFGEFDFIAIGNAPDPIHLVQVKSNLAEGIEQWAEDALAYAYDGVRVRMLVCHDRAGWRVIDPVPGGHEVVVDERQDSCGMGERVVEFLEGSR